MQRNVREKGEKQSILFMWPKVYMSHYFQSAITLEFQIPIYYLYSHLLLHAITPKLILPPSCQVLSHNIMSPLTLNHSKVQNCYHEVAKLTLVLKLGVKTSRNISFFFASPSQLASYMDVQAWQFLLRCSDLTFCGTYYCKTTKFENPLLCIEHAQILAS